MFGVSRASGKFQGTMEQMLSDLENAFSLQDDMIMFGDDRKCDETLSNVLKVNDVMLNESFG